MSDSDVKQALAAIERTLHDAESSFLQFTYQGGDPAEKDTAAFYVDKAFTQTLVLLDRLRLEETYQRVSLLLDAAQKDPGGKIASTRGPDYDEPYMVWPGRLRVYVDSVADVYGASETAASAVRELKAIVRRTVYAICNTALFSQMPSSEADVHERIEAILKCHYADLLSKPALAKPIKNFIPDSAIPSAKTLIEYKFVTNKSQAKVIVDQVLADTQGYKSAQFSRLLIVVYETHRLFSEEDWVRLLRECGLGADYDVVVLSGDAGLGQGKA